MSDTVLSTLDDCKATLGKRNARIAELQAALESIRDNSRDAEAVSIAASALAQKGKNADA